jgi:hypothetical protein
MTLSGVKERDAQKECPLFKFAPETRNEIYALVFAAKTQEDGSLKLEKVPADNALTRTCQQIYDESHKMYELASRDFPSSYTFTIDVLDRKDALASIPDVSMQFFMQMTSFRVNWRADDRNQGKSFRFTSHFQKRKPGFQYWSVGVDMHDEHWLGELHGNRMLISLRTIGTRAMYGHSSFASRVSRAVHGHPGQEDQIWFGFSSVHCRGPEDHRMSLS